MMCAPTRDSRAGLGLRQRNRPPLCLGAIPSIFGSQTASERSFSECGSPNTRCPNFPTRYVDSRTRCLDFRTCCLAFPTRCSDFRTRCLDFPTSYSDFPTWYLDSRTRLWGLDFTTGCPPGLAHSEGRVQGRACLALLEDRPSTLRSPREEQDGALGAKPPSRPTPSSSSAKGGT